MRWLVKRDEPLPRGTAKKLAWISVLYFAEGFPFGIVYKVWPVYFRVHGVELGAIGLMALLRLPYTLKPAWAPLVDRYGSRQVWIAGCEFALAGVILALMTLDPSQTTWALWGVLLAFTVASATQDISIDAYAVDVATPRDSGHINGFRVAFYRAAVLFGGGLVLILADRPWFGWTGVWWLSAGICVALGAAALASPRVARERAGRTAERPPGTAVARYRLALVVVALLVIAASHAGGWTTLGKTLSVIAATIAVASFLSPEMLRWAFRREMVPIVAFGLLYKVGDNSLGQMVEPFWVDKGLSPTEIGAISSGVGNFLTIGGAILGGWFISRYGIFQALLWMGLGQLVSNFGYVAVAALDLPLGDATLVGLSFGPFQASLYAASMIESVTQGLGTAAFLSFLMNVCDRAHAATQYALLAATFSLSRDVAGAFSGFGVEAWGYPAYFTVTACLAVPGLLLLPFIKGRIREDGEGEEGGEAALAAAGD